jgi:hypothetical protein
MNTNFYQSFIQPLRMRFDKQNTSDLGQDAVRWPETGPKRGATNVVLRRYFRYAGTAIQKLTNRGIFTRTQIHSTGSPVGSALRRHWISLALVGSFLTGGLLTPAAQAQNRIFFYGIQRAGAVGHVTAASQIATDGQQGSGTFGAWTHIVTLGNERVFFYNKRAFAQVRSVMLPRRARS